MFCSDFMSEQNRIEHEINIYEMKSDFFSVKWDRIKFLFYEMRQNQILILWDETESNSHFVRWNETEFFFMRWNETENKSSFYEMKLNFHETECFILILQSIYTLYSNLNLSKKNIIILSLIKDVQEFDLQCKQISN